MTALDNPTPTPYSLHRPHPSVISPSSKINHHYLLNFAVSLAAILFGITIIAAFAVAVRWRKRTSQSYLLEPRIDARIPQSSISDASDGRSTISLKFPPPGLAPPENRRDRLPFLPRRPPHAHHPAPPARALQACQSCAAGSNNAPPCYCPTCPNGPGWDNPPAYRASPPSPGAIPHRRLSASFVGREDASPPRPSSTDENAIRRNFQRTPPTQISTRNGHDRSRSAPVGSPTPAGHPRGSVAAPADDNAVGCLSESSSSTLSPSNASFASASSRFGTSVARPLSPELFHEAGGAAVVYGQGPSVTPGRGPLELPLVVYQDQSDGTSAYIRVTPPSQDRLHAPLDGPRYGGQTAASGSGQYLHGPSSSTAAVESRDPLTDASNSAGGPHATQKPEKWFMDLDWFGRRSPPADSCNEHALAAGRGFGSAT